MPKVAVVVFIVDGTNQQFKSIFRPCPPVVVGAGNLHGCSSFKGLHTPAHRHALTHTQATHMPKLMWTLCATGYAALMAPKGSHAYFVYNLSPTLASNYV